MSNFSILSILFILSILSILSICLILSHLILSIYPSIHLSIYPSIHLSNVNIGFINPPKIEYANSRKRLINLPPVIKYANFFPFFFIFFPFSIRFQLGNSFGNTSVVFLGRKVPLCIRFQLGNNSFGNTPVVFFGGKFPYVFVFN